jgi:hypothetical protein
MSFSKIENRIPPFFLIRAGHTDHAGPARLAANGRVAGKKKGSAGLPRGPACQDDLTNRYARVFFPETEAELTGGTRDEGGAGGRRR